jgi:DNA-binding NarL/FixJ family response regulator
VKRIRVLMIATPRLQTDLISTALAGEPAVELVGQVGADAAAGAVPAADARVVIVGLEGGADPPGLVLSLLALHPRLKVLGVTSSNGQAVLYELRPTARSLGEVSPRMLVEAIVDAARAEGPEILRGPE